LAALLLIMQPDEALALLSKGATQIINENELHEKLALGRPLRVVASLDDLIAEIGRLTGTDAQPQALTPQLA